jgi:PKD repeat protein
LRKAKKVSPKSKKSDPMKKSVLFLLFLAATLTMVAQTGQRQMVLAEDFTSTLCTYCPGAALGMDDLLSHGKYVAVIAEHSNYGNNDPYKNTYSLARNSMYAVSAYPSVTFDGVKMYCGGSHTSSLYSSYLPLYNYCLALPSPVTMSMSVTHTGLDYTAVVTLVKTDVIPSTSNILYFFVTQSNVTYNWQGQNHLEHINRLMAPDQNGTAVDFSTGDIQIVTLNFTMDAAWPLEDCEFVATLQNKDAGQGNQTGTTGGYPIKAFNALQTIKQGTIDLTLDFTVTSDTVNINTPVTFTNASYGGYIGVPEIYQWYFPGATPDTSTAKNPVVSYSDTGAYDVTLIVNRGWQIDTLTRTAFIHAQYPVGMQEFQTSLITTVSPNPSHGIITLDIFSGKTVSANISVINAINVPVYRESGISFSGKLTKSIDLSNVAKGIYFVVVEQEGSKTVKKVIIN